MKIIEVIPILFDGGAERFIVDLSNQLAKDQNISIVLVSLYDNDEHHFLVDEINPGIRLIELGKKPGFDYRVVLKLFKLIQKEKPDIIHTHLKSLDYLLPIIPFFKSRGVHTIHNDAFKECQSKFIRRIRNLYYRFNLIIPVTISKDSSDSYYRAYRNKKNHL